MITNAHIILIAADFMRSPSVDLRPPIKQEAIHKTCKNKHKEIKKNKQENHTNLINLKNLNRPTGPDIGK